MSSSTAPTGPAPNALSRSLSIRKKTAGVQQQHEDMSASTASRQEQQQPLSGRNTSPSRLPAPVSAIGSSRPGGTHSRTTSIGGHRTNVAGATMGSTSTAGGSRQVPPISRSGAIADRLARRPTAPPSVSGGGHVRARSVTGGSAATGDPTKRVPPAGGARSRPLSRGGAGAVGVAAGTGASATVGSGTGTGSVAARPKTSSGPPPSESGFSAGLAGAGGAGTAVPKPLVRSTTATHSRVKSTASAGVMRPPSRTLSTTGGPSTSAVAGTTQQKQQQQQQPRPSTASSNSGAGTSLAVGTAPAAVTANTKPNTSSSSTSMAPPPRPEKPAFTTHQQHFTPMKPHLQGVPKPSTTSILAAAAAGPTPSRQPANIAAMAANARLQTELLQLSLLHRNSAASEAAWLESARVQLSTKWESLRDADAALRDQERAVVERRAVEALRAWGGGSGGTSLDARVQQLDSLVAAIWALASEPGSRFARATRKFERWVAGIGAVKEQRKRLLVTTRGLTLDRKPPTSVAVPGGKGRQAVAADDDDDDEDDGESPGGAAVAELPETEEDDADAEPVFVAPLDAAWHSERDALVARLDAWKRALAELDQHGTDDGDGLQTTTSSSSTSSLTVPPPLTQILVGLRALVNGMRAELDAMARIETDILAAEREWVRRAARAGEDGDGGGDAGKGGAGAIWRVL